MPVIFNLRNTQIRASCFRSLNLLAHAQIEELDIGSQCGGHGRCGGDRVLVTKGSDLLSPLTEYEIRHLSSDELQAGVRLACQAWPEADDLDIWLKLV
jgi:ferredoxin